MAAPPGPPLTPEFLAEDYSTTILGLTGAFAIAATVVVALRLYVRVTMLRFVGADDYLMIAATLCTLGTFACLCGQAKLHTVGRHQEVATMQEWGLSFRWNFAESIMVMLGVVFVKISIALFLMRIVPRKGWHLFLWASISESDVFIRV
jgi:hypothetical protein